MKLIIAEKPSVAAAYAAALGVKERKDGYLEGNSLIVTWCIGHLVSLAEAGAYEERYKKWNYEDLPILPEKWKYLVASGKEKQFSVLKSLMERGDVTELVNGCDAGREGELIFRLAVDMAGCGKPVSRLWISSMEDTAIREGFEHLEPGSRYESLYQSALCRQKADWLIGINATRLFSVLYHKTLNVGRVQTPTLAMLAERDGQITLFQKEKYYHVRLRLDGLEAVSKRISNQGKAVSIQTACQNGQAVCVSSDKERKTVKPPKLFDLTTLQREANRLYGFTAKQTLDYAQSLYEKKLLTYPRTDSRFLTSDMSETVSVVAYLAVKQVAFSSCTDFSPNVEAVISDKDVSDHHAIIPTVGMEKQDVSLLPAGERNLFLLVCCKLLCALAEPYIYEAVSSVFSCGEDTFTAKGKTVLSEGWKGIERLFCTSMKTDQGEYAEQEEPLPPASKGQVFEPVAASVTEHFTSPPKPYTEDTLLSAMERAGSEDSLGRMPEDAERKGLGTPATRASIIEKLVSSGFAERKGKNLIPTKDGINLVTVLPDMLTSPQLTADWENKLSQVARGELAAAEFMDGIEDMAKELVARYSHISEDGQKLFSPQKESIGVCPRCGEPIFEGKKNFYCGNRSCGFVLWKNDRFWTSRRKELTKKMAADFLTKGKTKVKGLYSVKKDTTYDAVIHMEDTGGKYINFKTEFTKPKGGR